MNVTLICVGKLKEKFFADAVNEYQKRLKKFCNFKIIELPDEKTNALNDTGKNDLVKEKEGKRILEKIPEGAFVYALAIDGKQYNSEDFSALIEKNMMYGSNFVWIIGGSLGLSDEVLKRANEKVSFSKLTFPHQLMRVIFSEQLYRAFKIMHNEPYHK